MGPLRIQRGTEDAGRVHDKGKPHPLGWGLALGVQGGGSAHPRGRGESSTLGTELGAEGAGAELRRTSDGRVHSKFLHLVIRVQSMALVCV